MAPICAATVELRSDQVMGGPPMSPSGGAAGGLRDV